jgi:hypothetical protein
MEIACANREAETGFRSLWRMYTVDNLARRTRMSEDESPGLP